MSAIVVPSGMLRISREGERDRVVYPVHADGWRQLGWTVHPPELELELEEDEPEPLEVDGSPLGVVIEPGSEGEGDLESEAEQTQPEPLEPLDLEGMTKAQIVAVVQERYGVNLDTSATRAELIEQAQLLEAGVGASPAVGAESAEQAATGGEDAVPELMI
ncbi:MAG: hypothetical protein WBN89_09625 [Prochlorococcaceae cyanobacterium]